jgi:hypothetical protein
VNARPESARRSPPQMTVATAPATTTRATLHPISTAPRLSRRGASAEMAHAHPGRVLRRHSDRPARARSSPTADDRNRTDRFAPGECSRFGRESRRGLATSSWNSTGWWVAGTKDAGVVRAPVWSEMTTFVAASLSAPQFAKAVSQPWRALGVQPPAVSHADLLRHSSARPPYPPGLSTGGGWTSKWSHPARLSSSTIGCPSTRFTNASTSS